MTTVYSNYSNGWKPSNSSVYKKYRAKLVYWISNETDTTITYSASLYVNINSSLTASYSGTMNVSGSRYTGSCDTEYGESNTVICVSTKTKTYTKTESATTASISGSVKSSNGGWTNVAVTATASLVIPARRYTLLYDNNGGSGIIKTQKKTQNEALTLTNDVPTLDGYDFVSWNTVADGTGTTYQRGGTLPADINQDVTLYATWHISYEPPQVANLRAYRTTISASGVQPNIQANGTRCYCDFEYTPSIDPDATTDSITITFGSAAPVNANTSDSLRYGYSLVNNLPATQSETVTITIVVTDYLGNEYKYDIATYISSENYIYDAFKGTQGREEYQSFAIGGIARDFNSVRTPGGDFDAYTAMSLVLGDCEITDSGTTLTVTAGIDSTDGRLAQAIIDVFDYAIAKEILEVI